MNPLPGSDLLNGLHEAVGMVLLAIMCAGALCAVCAAVLAAWRRRSA
jgi:hypothetical protein